MYREKGGKLYPSIETLLSFVKSFSLFLSRAKERTSKKSRIITTRLHVTVWIYIHSCICSREWRTRSKSERVRRKHPDWFHPDRPFPRILRFIVFRGWSERMPRVSIPSRSISSSVSIRIIARFSTATNRGRLHSLSNPARCMRCILKSWRATFTKIVEIGRHANEAAKKGLILGVHETGRNNREKEH